MKQNLLPIINTLKYNHTLMKLSLDCKGEKKYQAEITMQSEYLNNGYETRHGYFPNNCV